MKKVTFLSGLIFIFYLASDEGDIVITQTVNSEDYSIDKESYCRSRAPLNNLIWSEEFNENSISKSTWKYAVSNGFKDRGQYVPGWGNGELQYYTRPSKKNKETNTSDNLFIEDGLLKIQPIKKNFRGFNYTSARIHTKTLKDFSYPSRITICFKLPSGGGFWPAFWLMPSEDILWPQGGEIDIMESRGRISNVASSALHFGKKYNNKSALVGEVLIPRSVKFQEKFHSISLKWTQNQIEFYLDNEKDPYFKIDKFHPEFTNYVYPFNRKYYMIVNVAVGGKYDDYWVDSKAFCNDNACSNKENPDNHRFLIDWIEYENL
jgi:beta-glucanase (GH16 family)